MKKFLPIIFLTALLLSSCANQVIRTEFMMDTVITYDIKQSDPDNHIEHMNTVIKSMEAQISAHLESSDICRFNRGELTELNGLPAKLVGIAQEVSSATDGAYDITVAPLVYLWDVTNEGFVPPEDEEIQALMPRLGYDRLTYTDRKVTAEEGTEIDLGGIAKGYACGFAAAFLNGKGAYGTLNFGGNVAVMGENKDGWRIGIKNPFAPDTIIGVITADSGMIAVSGGYERYGEYEGKRYHHIIDPKTGYPAESDLASAAVWVHTLGGYEGALADALSTAIFVMGKDKALELYDSGKFEFEAVLIGTDGSITVTDGLSERFEKSEK